MTRAHPNHKAKAQHRMPGVTLVYYPEKPHAPTFFASAYTATGDKKTFAFSIAMYGYKTAYLLAVATVLHFRGEDWPKRIPLPAPYVAGVADWLLERVIEYPETNSFIRAPSMPERDRLSVFLSLRGITIR